MRIRPLLAVVWLVAWGALAVGYAVFLSASQPEPKWLARVCTNDQCVSDLLNTLSAKQASEAKVAIAGPSLVWVWYWQ